MNSAEQALNAAAKAAAECTDDTCDKNALLSARDQALKVHTDAKKKHDKASRPASRFTTATTYFTKVRPTCRDDCSRNKKCRAFQCVCPSQARHRNLCVCVERGVCGWRWGWGLRRNNVPRSRRPYGGGGSERGPLGALRGLRPSCTRC